MNRRHFISSGIAFGAASLPSSTLGMANESKAVQDLLPEIENMPNFCSHEHWGSLFSMGDAPEGFRADVMAGAIPSHKTTMADVILDPYMTWNLENTGINPRKFQYQKGTHNIFEIMRDSPPKGMKLLEQALKQQQLTGTYLCTRKGFYAAYGYDIQKGHVSDLEKINNLVAHNYQNLFPWYRELMAKVFLSELIRPVHPEFYASAETRAVQL